MKSFARRLVAPPLLSFWIHILEMKIVERHHSCSVTTGNDVSWLCSELESANDRALFPEPITGCELSPHLTGQTTQKLMTQTLCSATDKQTTWWDTLFPTLHKLKCINPKPVVSLHLRRKTSKRGTIHHFLRPHLQEALKTKTRDCTHWMLTTTASKTKKS